MDAQQGKSHRRKQLGNITLGRTIGTGTFASVREGRHVPTGEQVAVKVMHKKLIEDVQDKMNLSREIRILRLVKHPNIAQLLQLSETDKKIYLVMEHVGGGELFEKIINSPKKRLEEAEASRYFQQLIGVVEYLKGLGIVHRDLKPENILIGQGNQIKLIDFGLSNMFQKGERLKTACGSPCYAAPEIFEQGGYDPTLIDQWSCGIVLYTMLVGYLPFEHKNNANLYHLIKQGKYDLPDHLSPTAKDMLKQMMEPDAHKRISFNRIRQHPFCLAHSITELGQGLLPSQTFHLDPEVCAEMESLGYIHYRKDVANNALNDRTAAFFLLFFRHMKKRGRVSYTSNNLISPKLPAKSPSIKEPSASEQLPLISRKKAISMGNVNKVHWADVRRNRYGHLHEGESGVRSVHKLNVLLR